MSRPLSIFDLHTLGDASVLAIALALARTGTADVVIWADMLESGRADLVASLANAGFLVRDPRCLFLWPDDAPVPQRPGIKTRYLESLSDEDRQRIVTVVESDPAAIQMFNDHGIPCLALHMNPTLRRKQ